MLLVTVFCCLLPPKMLSTPARFPPARASCFPPFCPLEADLEAEEVDSEVPIGMRGSGLAELDAAVQAEPEALEVVAGTGAGELLDERAESQSCRCCRAQG